MKSMRVFLVNLDRDSDRLVYVDGQLKRLGISYERISAVYGRDLSSDQLISCFSPFRWWCAMGRPASPGEIGCALTHFSIYKRMIADGIDLACVLEDDIQLDRSFMAALGEVQSVADTSKPQVIMLSDHMGKYSNAKIPNGFQIVRSQTAMCTDGYCLTLPAAQTLLRVNSPIIVPCDSWGRWTRNRRIDLFHLLPSVCRQTEMFASHTTVGRTVVSELPLFQRFIHKSKRIVGKSADYLLLKTTGR